MTETYSDNSSLSPDTEAILLLCGRFGNDSADQHQPLTQKEYEALTRWLLDRKMRPADLLNLEDSGFAELIHAKIDATRIKALLHRGTALAFAMEKWQRSGLWILSRSDSSYPKRLKKVLGQSAPPLLYGAGDPRLLDIGGVAIIGSRDVTDSGLSFTANLAAASVKDGMGIVSGGAKGVDAAAMQAGGEAGGVVIGVLASDLLKTSVVRQNRQGIQSGQLVLISPFNPESGFNVGNAMARNRYIYALADYAVVVDSTEGKGGTWAGAVENLRNNWTPLYVRDSYEKPGNYALIAKGGMKFNFQFSNDESLKEYFEKHSSSYRTTQELTIEIANAIETNKQLVEIPGNNPEPNQDFNRLSSLELFDVFIERLLLLLKSGSKSDEDIRIALGLEKAQIKVWLLLAVSKGFVDKNKNPTSYSLPRQTTLC